MIWNVLRVGFFIVLAAILFFGLAAFCYFKERRTVRGGCCGGSWEVFDYDSQGGQGLRCPRCSRTTWVSWFKMDDPRRRS